MSDKELPPNISTGTCCLYCWYGSWDMDRKTNEDIVRCNKYKVTMSIAQICDSYHDDETSPELKHSNVQGAEE